MVQRRNKTFGHVTFNRIQDIYNFADQFLSERLSSLEFDVDRCLRIDKIGSAPVSALLYCVSILNLLGGLNAGNVRENHTNNTYSYIDKFMRSYDKKQRKLLWEMYRHNIVHLSFPQVAIRHEGKIISWNLHDTNISNHLTIIWKKEKMIIGDNLGEIPLDGKVVLNIRKLKDDIKYSVNNKAEGYLAALHNNSVLRDNFRNAINQIYEVN